MPNKRNKKSTDGDVEKSDAVVFMPKKGKRERKRPFVCVCFFPFPFHATLIFCIILILLHSRPFSYPLYYSAARRSLHLSSGAWKKRFSRVINGRLNVLDPAAIREDPARNRIFSLVHNMETTLGVACTDFVEVAGIHVPHIRAAT